MKNISTAVRLFLALTILTGIVYPLLITAIGQGLFAGAVNGSAITKDGQIMGSQLVGQSFTEPKYFWGRPSASGEKPYNAALSGGSNLGPTNAALVGGKNLEGNSIAGVLAERVEALKSAFPSSDAPVPTDLATASGSGLDPHISIASAEFQAGRVAEARGLAREDVMSLVRKHSVGRQFGLLGEPVVNVLELNLALDEE